MADVQKERAKARRDYLIAGALAMAAAIVGIVDQGAFLGAPLWLVAALMVLAAAACSRVVYSFSRRDDGDTGPTVERMRKVALVWLILAAVLGIAVLRAPATALREAGTAGLRARDWAAAGAGVAIVVAACARAVRAIRGTFTGAG